MPTQSELFKSNLDLVPKVCSRWNYDTPTLGDDDRMSIARLELWEAAAKYDGVRPFRSYAAVRIANALRDAMRRDSRSRRVQSQSFPLELFTELTDGDSFVNAGYREAITDQSQSADDMLINHEMLLEAKKACASLPEFHRDVIKKRYLGDRQQSLTEIGMARLSNNQDHRSSLPRLGRNASGTTRQRIQQIEVEALRELREVLTRY